MKWIPRETVKSFYRQEIPAEMVEMTIPHDPESVGSDEPDLTKVPLLPPRLDSR